MPRTIVMDELRLTVSAPRGLPEAEYDGISRTIAKRRFRKDLQRGVRGVFARYPALNKARATVKG